MLLHALKSQHEYEQNIKLFLIGCMWLVLANSLSYRCVSRLTWKHRINSGYIITFVGELSRDYLLSNGTVWSIFEKSTSHLLALRLTMGTNSLSNRISSLVYDHRA